MTGKDSDDEQEMSIVPAKDLLNELSGFQRDMLIELAKLEDSSQDSYGLALQNRLESRYSTNINHGRLYPNLDELVRMGIIKKGQLDNRTNEYRLTDTAHEMIRVRYLELKELVYEQ